MDLLRDCYDIMGRAGMPRPPFDVWRQHVTENAEIWPIGGRAADGRPVMVGFVLFKGHSIHVAVLPEWRGRWVKPSMLKAWREKYQHDCDLYATPDTSNTAACRLVERLGFRLQRTLGKSSIYVKERTTCPSPQSLQS